MLKRLLHEHIWNEVIQNGVEGRMWSQSTENKIFAGPNMSQGSQTTGGSQQLSSSSQATRNDHAEDLHDGKMKLSSDEENIRQPGWELHQDTVWCFLTNSRSSTLQSSYCTAT